jgi:hypothetical protein
VQDDKKTYRSATPEEMAPFQGDAGEAEHYHFGYGLTDEPKVEGSSETDQCLIVDRLQDERAEEGSNNSSPNWKMPTWKASLAR